jgi:hypothetical protein
MAIRFVIAALLSSLLPLSENLLGCDSEVLDAFIAERFRAAGRKAPYSTMHHAI